MKDFCFSGHEGFSVHCLKLEPKVKTPKALLIVVHGMQEHVYRYVEFAEFFAKRGFCVYVPELRGHGKNIIENVAGYDRGDLFSNVLKDCKILAKMVQDEYRNVPLYVLGHSFGSFVSQRWILENESVDKFVLSGSTYTKTALMSMGGVVASLCSAFSGRKAEAKLVEKMSLCAYGKTFDNGNWLSRDESVWQKYVEDPLCGKAFPNSFYCSMFKNVTKNYRKLSDCKKVPILLIGGEKDPVSGFSSGLKKLHKTYKNKAFDVQLKLYENARHEVLNETNKREVFDDVLAFLEG